MFPLVNLSFTVIFEVVVFPNAVVSIDVQVELAPIYLVINELVVVHCAGVLTILSEIIVPFRRSVELTQLPPEILHILFTVILVKLLIARIP